MSNLFRWISGNFSEEELYRCGLTSFCSHKLADTEPTNEVVLASENTFLRLQIDVLRSELVLLR